MDDRERHGVIDPLDPEPQVCSADIGRVGAVATTLDRAESKDPHDPAVPARRDGARGTAVLEENSVRKKYGYLRPGEQLVRGASECPLACTRMTVAAHHQKLRTGLGDPEKQLGRDIVACGAPNDDFDFQVVPRQVARHVGAGFVAVLAFTRDRFDHGQMHLLRASRRTGHCAPLLAATPRRGGWT